MLKYLEHRVFKEQAKRCDAAELQDMLRLTHEKYAHADDPSNETSEGKDPTDTGINSIRRSRWWRPSQIDSEPSGSDRRWLFDSHKAFKGWSISPDGFLIAFWSDIKISLYTSDSQSLRPGETTVAPSAQEFTLDGTGPIWKSISLTDKYLIAFTSEDRY